MRVCLRMCASLCGVIPVLRVLRSAQGNQRGFLTKPTVNPKKGNACASFEMPFLPSAQGNAVLSAYWRASPLAFAPSGNKRLHCQIHHRLHHHHHLPVRAQEALKRLSYTPTLRVRAQKALKKEGTGGPGVYTPTWCTPLHSLSVLNQRLSIQ